MHVFIDESGSLGKGGGRYFVIAAVCARCPKRLKHIAKRFCVEYTQREVKGAELSFPQRQKLINKIIAVDDYSIVYIVLDKKNLENKKLLGSNILFNYLCAFVFESIVKMPAPFIVMHFDNRTVRTGSKYSLPDYLRVKMLEFQSDKALSIHFCDSHVHHGIQIADLISNTIYQRYNYGKDTLYKQLHIKDTIRFPQNKFGA